jgi:hypothetical protein
MAAVGVALTGVLMSGQAVGTPEGVDLSGNWVSRNFTESLGLGPRLRPVDFLGFPLTDAGRAGALSYDQLQISVPERQCAFYTPTYFLMGPVPFKIFPEWEFRTGSTLAWVVAAWGDVVPLVIWMDGRPRPSAYAPHPKGGFTTGEWQDDVLTTYTTHMEAGMLGRRVPHSDLTTMTTRFSRHGDILSVTARIEDPVNLTEPLYVSREFQLSATPMNPAAWPCTVADEAVAPGHVPHHLPGRNPFVNEMTDLFGIPVEAVLGGAETMYPEYRKKIRDKYVRPEKCPTNPIETAAGGCGRPGMYPPVI